MKAVSHPHSRRSKSPDWNPRTAHSPSGSHSRSTTPAGAALGPDQVAVGIQPVDILFDCGGDQPIRFVTGRDLINSALQHVSSEAHAIAVERLDPVAEVAR